MERAERLEKMEDEIKNLEKTAPEVKETKTVTKQVPRDGWGRERSHWASSVGWDKLTPCCFSRLCLREWLVGTKTTSFSINRWPNPRSVAGGVSVCCHRFIPYSLLSPHLNRFPFSPFKSGFDAGYRKAQGDAGRRQASPRFSPPHAGDQVPLSFRFL